MKLSGVGLEPHECNDEFLTKRLGLYKTVLIFVGGFLGLIVLAGIIIFFNQLIQYGFENALPILVFFPLFGLVFGLPMFLVYREARAIREELDKRCDQGEEDAQDIKERVSAVNKENIWIGCGIGVFIVCITFFIIKLGAFFGAIVGGVVGLIAIVAVAVLKFILEAAMEERAEKKAFNREHPHHDAEQFYRDCLKAGAKDAASEADQEKIAACAREQGMRRTKQGAVDFYLLGKSEVERIQEKERKEALERLRREEADYEKHTTRFAKLAPHEKMRATCLELAELARERYEYLGEHMNDSFDSADRLYNMSKRKEYDWATMGGIASGLGGIGAGIAVAADAQIKNAEIRQQNAQLQDAAYRVAAIGWMNNAKKRGDAKDEMERWETRAANASKNPVKEMDQDKLLEILSPTLEKKKRSDTGAMLLKVKIPPYYENCPKIGKRTTFIDGTIKAVFWSGKTRVGDAILMLPSTGSTWGETNLEGICRNYEFKPRVTYKVTFEPDHLWVTGSAYDLPDGSEK